MGLFLENIAYTLPLGLPVATVLLVRRVQNPALKVIAALAGAAAGWVYYTWFRAPG